MEGTSQACPHVSGVAALGLSYAAKLHRHFRADEFRKMILESVKPVEPYFTEMKYIGTQMLHLAKLQPDRWNLLLIQVIWVQD